MHTTSKGNDMTSRLLAEARHTLENYPTDVFMGLGLTRQPLSEIHPTFVKTPERMLRITIDVPASEINWDGCTCVKAVEMPDEEPGHDVDVDDATFWGHLICFDDIDAAHDYMAEVIER